MALRDLDSRMIELACAVARWHKRRENRLAEDILDLAETGVTLVKGKKINNLNCSEIEISEHERNVRISREDFEFFTQPLIYITTLLWICSVLYIC